MDRASDTGWVVSILKMAIVLAVAIASLLWWRSDTDFCDCEWCPDGYCAYAGAIHTALTGTDADWSDLAAFGRAYTHAHSPLAPALIAALPMRAGLAVVPAFALLSGVFTLLAWIALKRSIAREWSPGALARGLAFVAFFSNALVARGFVRPLTDAVGLACTAWSLYVLQRHVASPSVATGRSLFAAQLVGLFSRVSFIPMLALPAFAALARDRGPLRARLRDALVAGFLYGALPGLGFLAITRWLGIEHLGQAWVFAHRPGFTAEFTTENLRSSLIAIGLPLLAASAGAASLRGWSRPAWRINALWIGLYLAFLVSGRTALLPRYFLPLVPSLVIVAMPTLIWIADRGRWAAALAAIAVALPGIFAIEASALRSEASLGLLADALRHGSLAARSSSPFARPLARSRITITRVSTAVPPLLDQLDLETPRRIRAIGFRTEINAGLPGVIVEGTRDGGSWIVLAERDAPRRRMGFFAVVPSTFVELRRAGRMRSLRLRWIDGAAPPVADVVVYPLSRFGPRDHGGLARRHETDRRNRTPASNTEPQ